MQSSKLKFKVKNFNRGFTLIELLVVISIIGLLASFLVANFVNIKERARDGERKSDLYNIQAALEIFRSDQGIYPTNSEFPAACGMPFKLDNGSTYMQSVPCDPSTGSQYNYTYTVASGTYEIFACLENGSDAQIEKDSGGNPVNCPNNSTLWKFTLKNP